MNENRILMTQAHWQSNYGDGANACGRNKSPQYSGKLMMVGIVVLFGRPARR